MRYGFYLPTRGPLANRSDLSAILDTAEKLGFASTMVADHIILPTKIDSAYPYTVKGNFLSQGECFEQLALMSFVAARTETMRIVSSVMIVPHRNPVFNAKSLATIDVLSEGRVTVGIGVGWMEEEFKALGTAPFKDRGRVTDEYVDIFRKLWTGKPVSYQGEHYSFEEVICEPVPIQQPGRRSGLAAIQTLPSAVSRNWATAGTPLVPPPHHHCRRPKCGRSWTRSKA